VVFGRISKRTLAWIFGPAGLLLLLHAFVLETMHVVGQSMADTLEPGDLVLVSKLARTESRLPGRGDVVAFRLPAKPSLLLVKRVVGLPGDHIVIEGGSLRIHDAGGLEWPDPERSQAAHPRGDTTPGHLDVVVPNGELFLVGDNRSEGASSDSRDWGSVPSETVVGRVFLVLAPFARAGRL
jgi:signal peptidase I